MNNNQTINFKKRQFLTIQIKHSKEINVKIWYSQSHKEKKNK